MDEYMLSTNDNPFDPFTQFDQWFGFDTSMGYHSLSFLARIVRTSHDLSEADQNLAIKEAIDEIVEENVLGIYKMVTKKSDVTNAN